MNETLKIYLPCVKGGVAAGDGGIVTRPIVTAEQMRFMFLPDNPSVTRRARDSPLYTRGPRTREILMSLLSLINLPVSLAPGEGNENGYSPNILSSRKCDCQKNINLFTPSDLK